MCVGELFIVERERDGEEAGSVLLQAAGEEEGRWRLVEELEVEELRIPVERAQVPDLVRGWIPLQDSLHL